MGWPEPPQPQSMSRTLQPFDAAGKPFPVTTSGHTDFSDDGQIHIQTMQFTFRGESGLPAKLVVVGPRTVFVEVPFALENVRTAVSRAIRVNVPFLPAKWPLDGPYTIFLYTNHL